MGVIENITHKLYPQQSDNVGKQVDLCFHYNTRDKVRATIIRDDLVEPGEMIFLTHDGRVILSTECQYQLPDQGQRPAEFVRFKPYKR